MLFAARLFESILLKALLIALLLDMDFFKGALAFTGVRK
jgi:hypothetical protein